MFTLLVLALVSSTVSLPDEKGPEYRCAPSEWEGEFFGTIVVNGSDGLTSVNVAGNVTNSYLKQTEYVETITELADNSVLRAQKWRLWSEGVELEYSSESNSCRVSAELADAQMRRGCIGTSENSLLTSYLIDRSPADLVETTGVGYDVAHITYLRDGMVPVSLTATGDYEGGQRYMALQYTNVITLEDYGKLDLPEPCQLLLLQGKKTETVKEP